MGWGFHWKPRIYGGRGTKVAFPGPARPWARVPGEEKRKAMAARRAAAKSIRKQPAPVAPPKRQRPRQGREASGAGVCARTRCRPLVRGRRRRVAVVRAGLIHAPEGPPNVERPSRYQWLGPCCHCLMLALQALVSDVAPQQMERVRHGRPRPLRAPLGFRGICLSLVGNSTVLVRPCP